ncbi:MAG: hypothetical protein B9S32_10820 [Verrucomicrobia bacterium Tous-C9LFEB]|nr:MAG: hypothetical protein B9S32_10820 [Verrucomicrobia bacterium Tous-C9LFEB]
MNSWIVILLGLMGTVVLAAEPEMPRVPPSPPFVKSPPPGSQWSVEIKTVTREKTSPVGITPIRLEKRVGTNRILEAVTTYTDGTRKTFYIVDESILQRYDNSDKIAVFPVESGGDFASLRTKSFPGLGWLSASNYAGLAMIKKSECAKFLLKGGAGSDLQADMILTAWIRVSDGYPVRAQLGDVIYEYSEVTSYSREVPLPAEYQEALGKLRAGQSLVEKLKAKAAR